MNQDKYVRYLSEGKDPFKEEFNKLVTCINKVLEHDIPQDKKLEIIEMIMDDTMEVPVRRHEHKSQLKLEM